MLENHNEERLTAVTKYHLAVGVCTMLGCASPVMGSTVQIEWRIENPFRLFADSHRRRVAGRGVCAGIEQAGVEDPNELLMPRWLNGAWRPYRPSLFKAYAPRRRWLRTSNDAFLTAHIDLSSDIRRTFHRKTRYSPVDLLKASTFGGAFHPTAEGQAAFADAVLPHARKVVSEY